MPELRQVVINTGPLIALVAGLKGDLSFLGHLYAQVKVPRQVWEELRAGGPSAPELQAVTACPILQIADDLIVLPTLLAAELDPGEASVIQTALAENLTNVIIDEKAGRRMARLNGLNVTGSLGVLLRAKREGLIPNLSDPLARMREQGIWINPRLVDLALRDAGEKALLPP